jgi:shikimate kinase
MNQRVVILGFMACGKTTVGRELARQLDCKFVDLDSYIIELHGRSPANIIQKDGEDSFRKIEALALQDVLQDTDTRVVALGGGAWTIPENRTIVNLHGCKTVWLDTPFETCWKRIISNSDNVRPMAPDRDSAELRYNERRPAYELAEMHIATAGLEMNATVSEILLRVGGAL